jgi:hypothetical protein
MPNKRFIWVITSVQYTFTAGGARMISATGYEAKWLLSKRCILTPKYLDGYITSALYELVNCALGSTATAERKINGFAVDTNEVRIDIQARQTPRENLLEYANRVLKAYNCGSIVELINGNLTYRIFTGEDKTNSVRFTQSLDNLLSSEYITDDASLASYALVVSTIDDIDYTQDFNKGTTGIDRAEIVVKSDVSATYEDANGNSQDMQPTSDLFISTLQEEGKNALADHITSEEIKGELDIANSSYAFDNDFFLGDMVKVQDEYFNFYKNAKISKYTFKQDANGYGEEAEYGG